MRCVLAVATPFVMYRLAGVYSILLSGQYYVELYLSIFAVFDADQLIISTDHFLVLLQQS